VSVEDSRERNCGRCFQRERRKPSGIEDDTDLWVPAVSLKINKEKVKGKGGEERGRMWAGSVAAGLVRFPGWPSGYLSLFLS
jgi:hypothetical protein